MPLAQEEGCSYCYYYYCAQILHFEGLQTSSRTWKSLTTTPAIYYYARCISCRPKHGDDYPCCKLWLQLSSLLSQSRILPYIHTYKVLGKPQRKNSYGVECPSADRLGRNEAWRRENPIALMTTSRRSSSFLPSLSLALISNIPHFLQNHEEKKSSSFYSLEQSFHLLQPYSWVKNEDGSEARETHIRLLFSSSCIRIYDAYLPYQVHVAC